METVSCTKCVCQSKFICVWSETEHENDVMLGTVCFGTKSNVIGNKNAWLIVKRK